MQTKTISVQEKTIEMLEAEARALETLIARRQEWLDNPANYESRKYGDTRRDTLSKVWELQDINNQIAAIKQEENSPINNS
jgi:hypothetical protein